MPRNQQLDFKHWGLLHMALFFGDVRQLSAVKALDWWDPTPPTDPNTADAVGHQVFVDLVLSNVFVQSAVVRQAVGCWLDAPSPLHQGTANDDEILDTLHRRRVATRAARSGLAKYLMDTYAPPKGLGGSTLATLGVMRRSDPVFPRSLFSAKAQRSSC
jgi:hypothetical protein